MTQSRHLRALQLAILPLTIGTLLQPQASAAFYLPDDQVPAPIAHNLANFRPGAVAATAPRDPPRLQAFEVPFLQGHGTLGPVGRNRTQQAVDNLKGSTGTIQITASGDSTKGDQESLAKKRADTLRQKLIAAGFPASRINIAISEEVRSGDIKNTVIAEVSTEISSPAPATTQARAARNTAPSPLPPSRAQTVPDSGTNAAISSIASMLQSRQIDSHTATAMLMALTAGSSQVPLTQPPARSIGPISGNYRALRLSGSLVPEDARIDGQGRQVNLLDAVIAIVPPNVKVRPQGVPREARKLVNWNGGRSWLTVLDDLLARSGLIGDLNTDTQDLSIRSAANNALNAPPPQTWVVDPSMTRSAKQTLALWCEQSGWTADWSALPEGADFELSYPATYSGDFLEAVSAFAASLDTPNNTGVEPIFHGNHIVRIVPKGAKR